MGIINESVYKIIEFDKSSVAKSVVIFMEAIATEYAKRCGLPAPQFTDLLFQNNSYIFATKLFDYKNAKDLAHNNTKLEEELKTCAEYLKQQYDSIDLVRQFDLKDMFMSLNSEGKIIEMVPVDFGRLKFNKNLNWNLIYQICNEWNITLPEQYQNMANSTKTI